ncbi:MAG TPA: glycoside hydrolase family 43 protein [Candidatus Paceibacterota bacterium]|nr:glycoside hydrolase family 43 protein [Candidatus Paceibacterota bacterium]
MQHRTTNIERRTPKAFAFRLPSMFRVRCSLFNVPAFLLLAFALSGCATAPTKTNDVLLFSFFREPNGQAGLQLCTSTNGLQWTELKAPNGKSFIEPQVGGRLMRDPSLALGPDGTFHMVWTTSWGRPPVFGYASSKDLIHWSEQRAIPVMEDAPDCQNVWAPELFYDSKKAQWLIFWASTIPGKFPETENSGDNNHRIYYVTTKDFQTFSKTRLLYDGGFNVIDACLLPAKGKFYLVVKDETKNPVKKDLHLAVGDSPEGPFSKAGPTFTTNWVEGPSAIQWAGEYYVYFDHYGNPQYYGAMKSADLEHWQDISTRVSLPKGIRHGTVLKVPESIVSKLQNLQNQETTK